MKKFSRLVLAATLAVSMIFGLTACSQKPAEETAQQAEEKKPEIAPIEEGKQGYFVDALWLKENADKVVVIDARADKEYAKGHVPGAINITWQMLSNMQPKQGEIGWGVVLGKEELEKKLGSFGIDGSKDIVIYNDPKGLGEDGRVLWMLRIAGLENSRLLDGGYPMWLKAGGEESKEVPQITAVDFKIANYNDSTLANTDMVKEKLGTAKLVDTRSPEEFEGKTDHGEKVRGRIPGAIHLHYQDLYNVDGTVKSIADLKAVFESKGLKPEDEIITYCTVGIRSGFTAEMMRMVGYENVRNYNASFSEWAGTDQEFEK